MNRIFKYPIKTTGVQEILMPIGAKILCVQVQRDQPCIWAEVPGDDSEKKSRTILIYGNGHSIDEIHNRRYIGTYQLYHGDFVGHVFEKLYPNRDLMTISSEKLREELVKIQAQKKMEEQ